MLPTGGLQLTGDLLPGLWSQLLACCTQQASGLRAFDPFLFQFSLHFVVSFYCLRFLLVSSAVQGGLSIAEGSPDHAHFLLSC